ncbi:hypothetical protein [Aeromicrobium ginsengisoli]|uniref:Uncharacterized protein n=1 Tax=Aeromicrobium ginsengisoli TaxID=363867 RepID=A0A5M4FD68_9ACTN|nr:hypothetical protein [Aeromicrobium ginsengisoli]KAA1397257.1 hypothetical protein ESP70_007625 [Aeromicrobium ginsengisoli]
MRLVRGLLLLTGLGFGLWGVWLMRDFTSEQLVSMGTFLAGGVLLHDAVIAPVTVLLGVVAARLLPGRTRSVAAIAFLVWATLTVAFVNVLSGQGGKPDNDTVLHRPYGLSWVVMTALIAAIAATVAYRRRRIAGPPRSR